MVETPNRDSVACAIKVARELVVPFRENGWPDISQLPEPERTEIDALIDEAASRLHIAAPERWPVFNADGTPTLPRWHRGLIDNLSFAKTALLLVKVGRREDAASPEDVLRCLAHAEVCEDSIPATEGAGASSAIAEPNRPAILSRHWRLDLARHPNLGEEIARLVKVQSRVRDLAYGFPEFAEALRRAFIDFQAIRATYEESRDGTSSHGAPPNPESVSVDELATLGGADYLTVALYRLGGLADLGLSRPFVPKPKDTGDMRRDVEAQAVWSRRFPNALGEHENVELSPDELPPDIAEEMLACVEQWAREQGWITTPAPESSFGRSAQRETATSPTRAASGDGVVPPGGGVSAAPSYLADVRAFVAAADACVAEVERWRQEDGHFVSPGLDRRWRTPFGSMQRLYAEKIAPLCQCPLELRKDQGPFDWVREHHADGEDRIMLNQDCGHVVARLATERAEHDTVKIPTARAGDAKALLKRLWAWLAGFDHCDSGGPARGGNAEPSAPAIEQTAIERAAELGAERAAEKVALVLGGGDKSDAKPPAVPAGTGESAGPALTPSQSRVLKAMALFDAAELVSAEKIAQATADASAIPPLPALSEETARKCVVKLIGAELAERPEGDRSGARLTIAGRRLAGKIAD